MGAVFISHLPLIFEKPWKKSVEGRKNKKLFKALLAYAKNKQKQEKYA